MATVATRVDVFTVDADMMTVVSVLRLFSSGRHSWVVELEEVRAVEEYVRACAPPMVGAVGGLARKAWTSRTAWTSSSADTAASLQYEVTAATIHVVLANLERPGVLVVEDLVSDRAFVDAIIAAYDEDRVQSALVNGWLEVRHAGGGGRILAVAKDEAQKFANVPRVGAVLDSDSLYPGHQTSAHSTQSRMKALGLSCLVLKHREIENYIPNRALATLRPYSKFSKRIGALKALSPEQRSHFDMKNGLCRRSPNFARMPQNHQDLYANASVSALAALEEGFGGDVIRCLASAAESLAPIDFETLSPVAGDDIQGVLHLLRSLI